MKVFLVTLLLVSHAPQAGAVVYQYFDEEGTRILTNNPHRQSRSHTSGAVATPSIRTEFRNGISYEYYPVPGGSFPQMVAAAAERGPFDSNESRAYTAQTRWTAGWAYKFNSSYKIEAGQVRIDLQIYDVEFRSDITVILPALAEGSVLGAEDKRLWEEYLTKLGEHEGDHVAIVRDPRYRQELMRRFSEMRGLVIDYDPAVVMEEAIRQAVEAETARVGHEVIKEIKDRNDEYDRVTEHGIKHELRAAFFGR